MVKYDIHGQVYWAHTVSQVLFERLCLLLQVFQQVWDKLNMENGAGGGGQWEVVILDKVKRRYQGGKVKQLSRVECVFKIIHEQPCDQLTEVYALLPYSGWKVKNPA